jgi:NitT/TauT family transport system permease protein
LNKSSGRSYEGAKPVKAMDIGARYIMPVTGVVLLLGFWQLIAVISSDPSILPGPQVTLKSAIDLLKDGYWRDLLATSVRAVISWLLALSLGIPLGLILGSSIRAHDLSRGVLAFLRSLPAFMLLMIPIALGTSGEAARIGTITFASALIIIDECAESLVTLDKSRIELLHAYRGSYWFILSRLLVFEALGRTIVPVARTTVSIAFIVAIICENLMPPTHGIGARLLSSLSALELSAVYAFLLLTGTVGFILNGGIHYVARRIIFWT